jgi:hypothetical protein
MRKAVQTRLVKGRISIYFCLSLWSDQLINQETAFLRLLVSFKENSSLSMPRKSSEQLTFSPSFCRSRGGQLGENQAPFQGNWFL